MPGMSSAPTSTRPSSATAAGSVEGGAGLGAASEQHLPGLDGVRGVAILLVMLHNLTVDAPAPGRAMQLLRATTTAGWVGVTLFFALSGFLITSILLRTRAAPHYLRNFFARRVLRIFPLYYASLIVMLVLVPHLAPAPRWFTDQMGHQVWFWTYLSNWVIPLGKGIATLDHYWSLAVEEQFYLVWPFVVRALAPRRLARLCVMLSLLSLASRIVVRAFGFVDPVANYYWTSARVDALALGALAAVMLQDPAGAALLARRGRALAIGAAVAVALLAAVTRGLPRHGAWTDTFGHGVLSLAAAILVVQVARAERGGAASLARGFFRSAFLRWLGRYSYGIYVVHGILDQIMPRLLPGLLPRSWVEPEDNLHFLALALTYFMGVAGVSCAVAFASYHLLEKRFLALKDRFAAPQSPS
jgi:peptidoglycan/LPS O-acetylase OafA/YrhL